MLNTPLLKDAKRITKKLLLALTSARDLIGEFESKRKWLSPNEIKEYRKNIKVYDVFTFFNELDLLEIRLNILDASVDYFVIIEATETFSGHPKPLYYEENKDRFKKWHHKIIHYVVDSTPENEEEIKNKLLDPNIDKEERQTLNYLLLSNTVGIGVKHWFKEFYQKESIKKCLTNLSDDDICYISDLDEIWNPDLIIDFSKDEIFRPKQTGYMYYLNNRSDENWRGWTGTIVTKYKNIKNSCLNDLRTHKKTRCTVLRNGGWHFAFQGGLEGAKTKLQSYKHPAYNPKETLPVLETRVSSNQDYKGRNLKLTKDERGLPRYLLANKSKYQSFFK